MRGLGAFPKCLEVVCNVPGCSDTVGIGVLYLVKADIKHTIHKFVGPFDGYLPLDRAAEHSADVASHPLDAHIVEGLHVLLCLVKELLVGTAHVLHGVCFAGGNLACEHPVDLGPPIQQAATRSMALGVRARTVYSTSTSLGSLSSSSSTSLNCGT